MRSIPRHVFPFLLAAAAGCAASTETFHPTEQVVLERSGASTARYTLSTPEGDVGRAELWSSGAVRERLVDGDRTVVRVALEVSNTSAAPLAVEAVEIDPVTDDAQRLHNVQPMRVTGATTVPPGRKHRIEYDFGLPQGIAPDDVAAFSVHWRVTAGENVVEQVTPFRAEGASPWVAAR